MIFSTIYLLVAIGAFASAFDHFRDCGDSLSVSILAAAILGFIWPALIGVILHRLATGALQ